MAAPSTRRHGPLRPHTVPTCSGRPAEARRMRPRPPRPAATGSPPSTLPIGRGRPAERRTDRDLPDRHHRRPAPHRPHRARQARQARRTDRDLPARPPRLPAPHRPHMARQARRARRAPPRGGGTAVVPQGGRRGFPGRVPPRRCVGAVWAGPCAWVLCDEYRPRGVPAAVTRWCRVAGFRVVREPRIPEAAGGFRFRVSGRPPPPLSESTVSFRDSTTCSSMPVGG